MGTRAPLSVVGLVLLLVLGALTPVYRAERAQNEDRLVAVQAVLNAREAAVRSGDRAAWLATVDPRAGKAFRDQQGMQFDGLRKVPLERYELVARLDESGDLSHGLDSKYGAPVYLPETRQQWTLRGFDDRDATDTLWLTFVQRGGRWYVGGDGDLAALGLDTARWLWDFGAVEVMPTEHFLTLYHPAQADRAKALSAIAEDAIKAQQARWDQPWSGRIPLILPESTTELEKLLQSTVDLDKFLAFVSYGAVRDDGWSATAPRIYIQDQNLSGYGRAYQVETLVHELTHAAGAPLAGPFIPAWVHEGVADWVATGRATNERKPKGSDGRLPRDYEFTTGSQTAIVLAYRESRSATSFLAGKAGVAAPGAFFRVLGEAKVAPGNADVHVDEALRRAAAMGLGDLEGGWARR